MFGVILYLYFLTIGFLYADMLFKEKDIYFRGWMGGVFGNVLLMAGIVLPSIFLGFTVVSHIVLVILTAALYFVIKYRQKNGYFKAVLRINEGEKYLDSKTFLLLIAPITLMICALMTNHILAPYEGGGYASGQSTFGDLQMHLGFVTSIAEQKTFPPQYAFLSGTVLNYPFFADMLSSSLYLFGAPLRLAVLLPSYVMALLLVMGFYILAFSLTKRKAAAILATVFFFFCGGFGFAYFLDGAKADPTVFTRIFTDYYHTPTNYNDHNMRWANSICDMIIPQRTTMAGWCTIIPALWLLTEAVKTNSRKLYITIGVFAGCMPMIHTHSFLALGMISAVLLFAYLPLGKDNKKPADKTAMREYLINWALFGSITVIMAFPQLIFWTFRQSVGNESFLNFGYNWVNHNDPYLWFYLKNWGITALFAVPAILAAGRDNKKLLAGCAFIFIVAELVLFQPNEYDNNKLFFIVYMVLLIVVSDWLVKAYKAMKNVRGRAYLAAVVIIAGTASGALTIGREYASGGEYQTFSKDDIAAAEFIKDNTEPSSVFLTSTWHINPVVSLAGRNIYLGSSLYVYFHGMGDIMNGRKAVAEQIYSASSVSELRSLAEENGIDYIFVGNNERNEYTINDAAFAGLQKVYDENSCAIYTVR